MVWPAGPILLPGGKGLIVGGKFCVNAAECCCIEYGDDCACCDTGKTPKYFTVTFAGILACIENPPAWFVAALAAINDTHLLTQVASCDWKKAFTTVLGGDCGYMITLTCSGGQWKLVAGVGNLDGYSNSQVVYQAQNFAMVCLSGLIGQANDLEIGDCAGSIPECGIFATGNAGYDGEADIAAGDQT